MVYSYDSEYASLLYKKCKDENNNEYIKIISGNVNGDFLNIPSTIDEIPVVEIENAAFLQGKFKYITLSQNLKFIRHSAFGNCSYLEEITFPDSLLCIEENAF